MMSRDTLSRVAEQVRANRIRRVYVVGNGEPTLHPHFCDYIAELAKATGVLSLTTNFQRVSEPVIDAILGAPVALLNISVDGASASTYERHRVGGSFSRLLHNIEWLRARRRIRKASTVINIRVMIHPSDAQQLETTRGFWRKFADVVSIQHVVDIAGRGGDVYDLQIPITHYGKCSLPFKMLQVRWDGSVPMCTYYYLQADRPADFILGNIQSAGLLELWSHPLIRHYRKAHRERRESDMALCAGCGGC
jgi:sulfatase maturation enzyme AslB (radical SAM superfamily)